MSDHTHPIVPLHEAVGRRRRELGYTKSELARRAQTTRSTIHEIENGTRKSLQPATYAALDEALRWPVGTLEAMTREKLLVFQSRSSELAMTADREVALLLVELLREVHEEMTHLRELYEKSAATAIEAAEAPPAPEAGTKKKTTTQRHPAQRRRPLSNSH